MPLSFYHSLPQFRDFRRRRVGVAKKAGAQAKADEKKSIG